MLFVTGCSKKAESPAPSKKLFIIHGYAAHPSDHWFPWLQSEAEKNGFATSVIEMPNPDEPAIEDWLKTLKEQIPNDTDDNTYFVAHSLGCITLLRHLESLPEGTKIGGYILVSGFSSELPILPQLAPFTEQPLDLQRLKAMTKSKVVIGATDDRIVPISLIRSLATDLDAQFIETESGGHFLASDGYEQFSLVWDQLQSMAK